MSSLTDEDYVKVTRLFESISKSMVAVLDVVHSIFSQHEDGLLPVEKGHRLLDLKNQMILSYVINLVHLVYEKVSGHFIEDSPDIERLVEIRTVLERLQPVEKKLTNDLYRKVKAAVTGVVDRNDPLSFKPNPQDLLSESEAESSAKSEDDASEEKSDVYRPSKSLPTFFDESKQRKRERIAERSRQRLLMSETVKDFARQYTDAPEEILDSNRQHANRRAEKRERERIEYEETYLTRCPPQSKQNSSKKRKAYLKKRGSKRRRTH